jgi:hypothetical protein
MAFGTVATFWAVSFLFVLTPGGGLGLCNFCRAPA